MVGPGLFEAVGEEFDGLVAVGVPEEKAGGGGTNSCGHPKNIFHRADFLFLFVLGLRLCSQAAYWGLDARKASAVISERY
jgi:hypothetical protein